MKLYSLLEMAAFTKRNIGFGLTQLDNDNFILSGGYRSGSSSSGTTRVRYDVYDAALIDSGANPSDCKVGVVELFVDDNGEIVGLVNITILPKFRKTGRGSQLVRDITDTSLNGLKIHDIQKKAKKFWDKVGVTYTDSMQQNGIIDKHLQN